MDRKYLLEKVENFARYAKQAKTLIERYEVARDRHSYDVGIYEEKKERYGKAVEKEQQGQGEAPPAIPSEVQPGMPVSDTLTRSEKAKREMDEAEWTMDRKNVFKSSRVCKK